MQVNVGTAIVIYCDAYSDVSTISDNAEIIEGNRINYAEWHTFLLWFVLFSNFNLGIKLYFFCIVLNRSHCSLIRYWVFTIVLFFIKKWAQKCFFIFVLALFAMIFIFHSFNFLLSALFVSWFFYDFNTQDFVKITQ